MVCCYFILAGIASVAVVEIAFEYIHSDPELKSDFETFPNINTYMDANRSDCHSPSVSERHQLLDSYIPLRKPNIEPEPLEALRSS